MSRNGWLTSAFLVLVTSPVSAQRVWLSPDPGRNVGLEIGKGFFTSSFGIKFASFVITAEGRFPVTHRVAITAAIPYATIRESQSFDGSGTSTAFGNPWIGAEIAAQPDITLEAGIRPGIASGAPSHDQAYFLGEFDDFNRMEAWVPKRTSVRAMAHLGRIPERGTLVTGIVGGTVFLAGDGGESVVYANYGVRLGVRDDHSMTSLTFTGRANLGHALVEGSLNRTENQVAIQVEGTRGAFRPRLSVGSFTSSIRNEIKAIATIGASYVF